MERWIQSGCNDKGEIIGGDWKTRSDILKILESDPSRLIVEKLFDDAFYSRCASVDLAHELREQRRNCKDIVVMGSYASQCVAATIRGALKAGFSVYSAGPVIRDYEKPEFRAEIDNIQSDQFYLYDFV